MRWIAAVVLLVLVGGCTPVGIDPDPSASGVPPVAGDAAAQLAALTVGKEKTMSGYSREKFPHWRKVDQYCDTRDAVLKRDGTDVKASSTCKITAGSWYSSYDGKTFTDPLDIDIDHMVPLANAWRSGAAGWTDEQRGDFANDLTRPQLLAVSASTNRSKGDQNPSQWEPANRAFHCEYARRWITVKSFWKLTVTTAEKATLQEMLGTCR